MACRQLPVLGGGGGGVRLRSAERQALAPLRPGGWNAKHPIPLCCYALSCDQQGERRLRGAGAGFHPWVPTPQGNYLPRYPAPSAPTSLGTWVPREVGICGLGRGSPSCAVRRGVLKG